MHLYNYHLTIKYITLMLCIEKIRFWSKVQGFLDRMSAPETAVKIIMDDSFELPQLIGTTKQNTTEWQQNVIPPIELSPYQQNYKISFGVYRQGVLIGSASTTFAFTETRKDCLDMVGSSKQVNGKLVYQLNWIKSTKAGNFITYQQYTNTKSKSNGQSGKQPLLKAQIPTQREKKYVKQEGDDDCGFCSCFAVRKKKTKKAEEIPQPQQNRSSQMFREMKQPKVSNNPRLQQSQRSERISENGQDQKFKNNPYIYQQEQLQLGKINEVQQLNRLTYYSKKIIISK